MARYARMASVIVFADVATANALPIWTRASAMRGTPASTSATTQPRSALRMNASARGLSAAGAGGYRGTSGLGSDPTLTPLAPDLGYSDLAIADGDTASRELTRLVLADAAFLPADRALTREQLLRYCERDTFAIVRVLSRLRELA